MKKKTDSDEEIIDDVEFEDTDEQGDQLGGMQNKVKKLKDELEKVKKERQEYLDGWQRTRAEFANAIKINSDEKAALRERTENDTLSELFPVLDSFDSAMKNKEVWEAVDKNWRIGVEYIKVQLDKILDEHNVKAISQENVPFDTFRHEPLEMVPVTDEKEDDMILQVIQKGYERNGKVLRTAKVKLGIHRGDNK